jgi:tRNA G18 (ribose-2'-O)-methylase SpoU
MPNIIQIDDITAAELDVFARLTEARLRSHERMFVAESVTVIEHALNAGYEPVSFLMERRCAEGKARALLERCPTVTVYTAERAVLEKLTGYALTRGVLCAMRRKALPDAFSICERAHMLCVLESITDSTNVGAIFRSAAALGMDGVLLTPTCCDPLNRRAMRVSMGTVLQVPWAYVGDDAAQWPTAAVAQLHTLGFRVAALALSDDSVPRDAPALRQEERLAIVLGAEGAGLPATVVEGCDYVVRIPMAHGVDSLNVAAAGAVAFWELRAAARARD